MTQSEWNRVSDSLWAPAVLLLPVVADTQSHTYFQIGAVDVELMSSMQSFTAAFGPVQGLSSSKVAALLMDKTTTG